MLVITYPWLIPYIFRSMFQRSHADKNKSRVEECHRCSTFCYRPVSSHRNSRRGAQMRDNVSARRCCHKWRYTYSKGCKDIINLFIHRKVVMYHIKGFFQVYEIVRISEFLPRIKPLLPTKWRYYIHWPCCHMWACCIYRTAYSHINHYQAHRSAIAQLNNSKHIRILYNMSTQDRFYHIQIRGVFFILFVIFLPSNTSLTQTPFRTFWGHSPIGYTHIKWNIAIIGQ